MQIVLQRGTGEQDAVLNAELAQNFGEARILVLHPVRLVQNQILPRQLFQRIALQDTQFVGGHHDVPLAVCLPHARLQMGLDGLLSRGFVAVELDRPQLWAPISLNIELCTLSHHLYCLAQTPPLPYDNNYEYQ